MIKNVGVDVVHQSLVKLVEQVFPVDLLHRDHALAGLQPLHDQLLVAGLVETQPVPVSLLVRQYPETKSLKYVILNFKSNLKIFRFTVNENRLGLLKLLNIDDLLCLSPLMFVQTYIFKSHVIIFRSACLKN